MKKAILCAVLALGLTACAVPVEMRENQKAEALALVKYHKAEREAYRAEEIRKAAAGAKVAATAAKMLADAQVQVALKALETEIQK